MQRRTRSLTPHLALAVLLGAAAPALSAPGGGGGGGGFSGPSASPQQMAIAHFQKGEAFRKEGVTALERAQTATDEAARADAADEAKKKFQRAKSEYKQATQSDRKLHYAWNGLGYTQRMLGDYDSAIASYEKALKLEPGFPNAVEYRAEAYLALGRLEEVKAAYLDLFGRERPFADLLMRKMQAWVDAQRKQPSVEASQIDAFSQWVAERATLAQQTASLAPESTARPTW
jgi:tetratricopeptide (TPR) repeat protein